MLNLSLFTGYGMMDLAAEWAGIEIVGQCDIAERPLKILQKHWPNVPKWRDIRDVTAESYYKNTGFRTVDIISGGDPCQPHSQAGLQKGKEDNRYLWPEMFRIIQEIKPNWIVNENVIGSISNGTVDEKIYDLEREGYTVAPAFIIPAVAVGAIHKRDRVFIIAYSERNKQQREKPCNGQARRMGRFIKPLAWNRDWENTLCDFRRMDDGLSYRVDRLDGIRNAVVPQVLYPIYKSIVQIENQLEGI